MVSKYYICILLNILSIHYIVGQISDQGLISPSTESVEILVERKITTSFNKLEENMIRQLEVMQNDNRNWRSSVKKQISELEENINIKLKTLEKIPELVENMKNKIDGLEKRMTEVQQMMETKLNPLDKMPELVENIKHKTDMLEKKTPELEQSVETKLNALEKIPQLVENIRHKTDSLEIVMYHIERNILNELYILKKKIPQLKESNRDKIDMLEKKMPEFEQNMKIKFNGLNQIPELVENITQKTNLLENSLLELDQDVKIKLNTFVKIPELVENIRNRIDVLEKTVPELEQNMEMKLNALEKIPISIDNVKHKLNLLDKDMSTLVGNINKTTGSMQKLSVRTSCKEYLAEQDYYSNIYPIAHESYRHVSMKKNWDNITYFEMHIAIKGSEKAYILLTPVPKPVRFVDLIYAIGVGIDSNQNTTIKILDLKTVESAKIVNTPNVLSANHYVNFYIKISNGTLAFGREGDKSPLLTYDDARVGTVNYIAFRYRAEKKAEFPVFLYDCPAESNFIE